MKIVYDISRLGEGYNNTRYQTGINRVVENIAYGLLSSGECSLSFCASESVQMSIQALDYLNHNQKLKNIPFLHSSIRYELYNFLKNLKDETANSLLTTVTLKSKVCFLNFVNSRLIEPYFLHFVTPKLLSKADIFHSPFYAIPEQIKKLSRRKNFLQFTT